MNIKSLWIITIKSIYSHFIIVVVEGILFLIMRLSQSILDREVKTIQTMIWMFCKKFHNSNGTLCFKCSDLLMYAEKRLKNCQFGEEKPTCEKCTIHCYKPNMREQIRIVMRYAGPRMIYTHPLMGFRHLYKKIKK